ncbi:MAG: hypothetical protein AAFN77_20700, partial [Planctomycetota bacterium]
MSKKPRRKRRQPNYATTHNFQALEERRLLANVAVGNNLDIVNGDTSSIAALITDDGGDGVSLREAISAANNTAGADGVTFDDSLSGETILLNGTDLDINDSLIIDASALSTSITIDADDQSRILNFTASTGDLTIDNLTITGGSSAQGGGVFFDSSGTLT